MLLFIGVALDLCAQSTILDNKLQFASSESSLPEGWDFVNCSLVESSNGKWFVQVNEGGSVTTPALTGLLGNARISFLVRPLHEDDCSFHLSVSDDSSLDRVTDTYGLIDKWNRGVPYLLRNATADTRIVFSGHNFQICNVTVNDVDDELYYESFNKCDGYFGYEKGFGDESKDFGNNKLDNPLCPNADNLQAGDKCLYFKPNGSYYTANMPISETGYYVLSFKISGFSSDYNMSVYYTPTGGGAETSRAIRDIPRSEWTEKSVLLSGIKDGSSIGFKGKYCFLDEVIVREVKNLSLDENSESASLPSSQLNKTVFAQLTRTFQSGIWNTCCLPFQFSASLLKTATGDDGLEVSLRKLSGISSDGVFTFASADVIPAGEPFLLYVSKTVTNPLFRNVVIGSVEPKDATDPAASGYAFRGCFGKAELATDGTNVFIGTDRQLHTPSASGNVMKGLRAYMVLPEKDAARGLVFSDETTGIAVFQQQNVMQADFDALYNLNGQRMHSSRPGIYVKGGKKIIIK